VGTARIASAGEEVAKRPDGLFQQREAVGDRREGDAVALVFGQGGAVAGAQGQDRVATRHRIERRGLLGEDPWRAQGDAGHHGPDMHPRVARRHGREHRERLQRGSVRARGRVEDRWEEVVG
jgi:hypothetical protein